MNEKQKILQCLHCGNKTLMNNVGFHKQTWCEDEEGSFIENAETSMFLCPVCGKITLFSEYTNNCMCDYNGEHYSLEEILYPINTFSDSSLPKPIKDSYEAALKTRNIDGAVCLIAIRRVLEIVCKLNNAKGNNLEKMIENLALEGIIPAQLKNASHLMRLFGNSAVHDNEFNISDNDIGAMMQLVKNILEYLYIIPRKIEHLQKHFENLKGD